MSMMKKGSGMSFILQKNMTWGQLPLLVEQNHTLVKKVLKKNNISVLLRRVHSLPVNEDDAIDLPFVTAKILDDAGILVGLETSGDMERMNSRNLPLLCWYGSGSWC